MTTNTNEPTGRAVIYVRVSTAAQANKDFDEEGYSIPAQRDACLRKAETLGAVVIDEYVDRGESAKSADRPQLKAMLARLQTERDVDYVIVHKVDRLARNRADDVAIGLTIRQAGAQLVSVSENVDATPSGKLLQAIMSGIAEFYSDNLATEAIKGMTEKAKKGGTPGRSPIGYRNTRETIDGREVRTVTVDPERAAHVQWAFATYATGEWSIRAITDELQRRGLVSVQIGKRPSKPLHLSRVAKMLSDPYYIGIVTFRGVRYPGRHETIIEDATFRKVQEVLASHSNGVRQVTHRHYLRGNLWCAECGSRLLFSRSTGHGGTYDYYFCAGRQRHNGCTQRYVNAVVIESAIEDHYELIQLDRDLVTSAKVELGAQLAAARSSADAELERQRRRIVRLTDERAKLLQAHYNDAVPLDLLKTEQQRIARELDDAQRLLNLSSATFADSEATINRALDLAGNCHTAYLDATPTVRRKFNEAFFTKIWVGRSGEIDRADLTEVFASLNAHVTGGIQVSDSSNEPMTFSDSSDPRAELVAVGSSKTSLVPPVGLEPTTLGLKVRCANQLRHRGGTGLVRGAKRCQRVVAASRRFWKPAMLRTEASTTAPRHFASSRRVPRSGARRPRGGSCGSAVLRLGDTEGGECEQSECDEREEHGPAGRLCQPLEGGRQTAGLVRVVGDRRLDEQPTDDRPDDRSCPVAGPAERAHRGEIG